MSGEVERLHLVGIVISLRKGMHRAIDRKAGPGECAEMLHEVFDFLLEVLPGCIRFEHGIREQQGGAVEVVFDDFSRSAHLIAGTHNQKEISEGMGDCPLIDSPKNGFAKGTAVWADKLLSYAFQHGGCAGHDTEGAYTASIQNTKRKQVVKYRDGNAGLLAVCLNRGKGLLDGLRNGRKRAGGSRFHLETSLFEPA